eukprot:TRINITY_DN40387_c0_g1_i1.p1 TRINITY_DN40387_c0_g1~~TRINITY_DN40387_c0_g1_i1.p1  ORF type:complete len:678 (+),score=151.11 TRINITY_DN40387_c0_g1_i1:221-2035(+)
MKCQVADPYATHQGLLHGSKTIIFPLLHWLFANGDTLKKRAYLARFLRPIDVPAEVLADEAIATTHQQVKALMEEFKKTHRTLDQMRGQSLSPESLNSKIMQLQEEKGQLEGRNARLNKRLRNVPNVVEYLKAVSELRRESERTTELASSLKEQKRLLVVCDQHNLNTLQRLKDVKAEATHADAGEMLAKLEADTNTNRYLLSQKLPKDLEEKRKKLDSLDQIQRQPVVSDEEISEMQTDVKRLKMEINVLLDQHGGSNAGGVADDKLYVYRQQARTIAQRKAESTTRFEELARERDRLKHDLDAKEAAYQNIAGTKVLKGQEFVRYAEGLREKGKQCKALKEDLARIRTENGILNRTEQVLKERVSSVEEALQHVEREKGVEGYLGTQEGLERVSVLKSQLDENKGKTLEEISQVVRDINANVKERKTQLVPIVKELKTVRSQFQDIQTRHTDKKSLYQNTMTGMESELAKLEHDLATINADCAKEESRFHELQDSLQSVNALVERALAEEEFAAQGSVPEGVTCYLEEYSKRIRELEVESRALREEQMRIKESHDGNLRQLEMFEHVRQLLECKIHLYMREGQELQPHSDAMGMQVERLVMG